MVCHSTAFVETVLAEKPYFNQISSYLKEQLNSLDCNEFDRVLRAIDQSEGLAPKDTTVDRGAFSDTLEGYHHLHWLAADWAAGNLSILLTGKPGLSLDDSISLAADNYIDNASSTEAIGYSESLVGKFTKRLSGKATGNWVVYICTKAGRYYLAISPHLTRKSSDEFELKELLDCISKEIPPEYR